MAEQRKYMPMRDVPALLLELVGVTRSLQVVYLWARKGRIAYDGRMVKLKTVDRLGGKYTTREWVENFVRAVG